CSSHQGTQGLVLGQNSFTRRVTFGPRHHPTRLELVVQVLQQVEHPAQKTLLEQVLLARFGQSLGRVRAHRIRKTVTDPPLELARDRDPRTVQQGSQQIEDVALGKFLVRADLFGQLQIPVAKHRQTTQQLLFRLRQPLVQEVHHHRQYLTA